MPRSTRCNNDKLEVCPSFTIGHLDHLHYKAHVAGSNRCCILLRARRFDEAPASRRKAPPTKSKYTPAVPTPGKVLRRTNPLVSTRRSSCCSEKPHHPHVVHSGPHTHSVGNSLNLLKALRHGEIIQLAALSEWLCRAQPRVVIWEGEFEGGHIRVNVRYGRQTAHLPWTDAWPPGITYISTTESLRETRARSLATGRKACTSSQALHCHR